MISARGQRPSHPELLDWLAYEFMSPETRDDSVESSAQPWSLKHIFRLMVNSQTYRQSSVARAELQVRDPNNELLARQTRLRLSAEAVRDVSLAASGLLNRTVGGPSVRPPQPPSVSQEGFDNKWETSPGADRYRRGLYTFIQRTSPFAQFVTFDFPSSTRACVRRERSNTPLQAMNFLNDPVFVERRASARDTGATRGDCKRREKVGAPLPACLARLPSAPERERLLRFFQEQRTAFGTAPRRRVNWRAPCCGTKPAEAAAWTAVASAVESR